MTGIQDDLSIRILVEQHDLISPFVADGYEEQREKNQISYGLTSNGYDIRLGNQFKICTNPVGDSLDGRAVIDPKNIDERVFRDLESDEPVVIGPHSFVLATSVEYIKMPTNLTGIVLGKSTYARCGIVTNFTPLEAGWEGNITIEISNTTPRNAIIYPGEGIAQILFFQGFHCQDSYASKHGKYQGQKGITLPKV